MFPTARALWLVVLPALLSLGLVVDDQWLWALLLLDGLIVAVAAADALLGLPKAAGFTVEKKPGHGRKKERLEAVYKGTISTATLPKSVAIIGAGIAGACAAHAFLRRGCSVTVFDRAQAPGAGASGNPLALVMPRFDAADGPQARALLAAYLYAQRFYGELGPEAAASLDAEHRAKGDAGHQCTECHDHPTVGKTHARAPKDQTGRCVRKGPPYSRASLMKPLRT